MKCLIIDKVYAGIAEELSKYMEVKTAENLPSTKDQLLAEIGDVDVLIMRVDPKIDQEIIDAAKNLKVIGVCSVGLNHIDMDYAKSKGIPVQNVPVYGTDNVSQFAVSLLMEVCSHIGHHNESVHKGEWASNADWCYWHYPMIEVSGKTAGIIGLGRIGVNTAKILKAMNVNVIAYDAFQSEAGKQVATYVELDELLAKSDFIFLHCPLFPSTEGIINKDNIAKMKDGVIFINVARGGLVDSEALADAVEAGKFRGVGMDVCEKEHEYFFEDRSNLKEHDKTLSRLLASDKVVISGHQAFLTEEALEQMALITMDNAKAFLEGAELVNEVK